jgi:hypothetical protein
MAYVFARIELRGKPSEEIYQKLHAYMQKNHWHQFLPERLDHPMPHAMYQAFFPNGAPDLLASAKSFKSEIERMIWSKAIVLLIEEANWAQSGA